MKKVTYFLLISLMVFQGEKTHAQNLDSVSLHYYLSVVEQCYGDISGYEMVEVSKNKVVNLVWESKSLMITALIEENGLLSQQTISRDEITKKYVAEEFPSKHPDLNMDGFIDWTEEKIVRENERDKVIQDFYRLFIFAGCINKNGTLK